MADNFAGEETERAVGGVAPAIEEQEQEDGAGEDVEEATLNHVASDICETQRCRSARLGVSRLFEGVDEGLKHISCAGDA